MMYKLRAKTAKIINKTKPKAARRCNKLANKYKNLNLFYIFFIK